MTKKPKIILWDIESAPLIAATFTLYPERIDHSNIIQDWFIICACWKELGSKEVHSVRITKAQDDKALVKKLRDVLADADLLIHQNGDKFDVRKLNARLIFHNLEPLPIIQTVDTLKQIRKVAGMTSNRLDYLGDHLVGQKKMDTARGLWLKAMKADKKAINDLVKYCTQDVKLLEKVYLRLRPYMKQHPHVGAMAGKDRTCTCPKCGGKDFDSGRKKIRYTAAGLPRLQLKCNTCYSYNTYNLPK